MRKMLEIMGLDWLLNKSSHPEFDIYFKKRNFFLLNSFILEFIGLICLCGFLIYSFNKFDNDYAATDVRLLGVLVYFCISALSLPLLFMSFSYNSICNVLNDTEKLKKLFRKRAELIFKFAKNNQIDVSHVQKNTEEVSAYNKTVFDRRIILWDQEIISWCEINKSNFKKKQFFALSVENKAINRFLAIYINRALSFCSKYDKNIQTEKYKEPYIPPMFFNAEDIAVFNQAKNMYKTY